MKRIALVVLSIGFFYAEAQQGLISDLYQYNYTSINPAFAGLQGSTFSALTNTRLPIEGFYGVYSYAAFETSTRNQRHGVGLTSSYNHTDWARVAYVSLPCNYRFRIDDQRKLVVGAGASYVHMFYYPFYYGSFPQGINNPLRYEDPITLDGFTTSLSVLYTAKGFFASLSADNVLRSEFLGLTGNGNLSINGLIGKDYKWTDRLTSQHSILLNLYQSYVRVDLNNTLMFESFVFGTSFEWNDTNFLPKFSGGLKVKDYGQLLLSFYSRKNRLLEKDLTAQAIVVMNLGSRWRI